MRRLHRAVLAAVLAGTLALLGSPPAQASWSDSETGIAHLTAATLPAATYNTCTNADGDITITWHYATTTIPGLSASTQQWGVSSGILHQIGNIITASSITNTGPSSAGIYTTTITAGALGNLVSLNSFSINSQTTLNNWTALSTKTAEGVSIGTLGIGVYTCTLG